ncbi:hypothetical protein KO519_07780 [Paraglaciecola agarilytica]|uniref:hypothetical protein n=1 Tax=Paraglaciecola chathamensis TaxID=368405 RepID=UPI001C089DC9|nr:hypothetical protein [Paraglaciecola agarilytica]MBU3017586.1 hypothetical protein [Paraglaciecola agarilytica]
MFINSAVERFFKIKGCAVSFHLYNAHLASGQPLKQLHRHWFYQVIQDFLKVFNQRDGRQFDLLLSVLDSLQKLMQIK